MTVTETHAELFIRADGRQDELLALLDWLSHDDALRGRVRQVPARIRDERMSGGLYEMLAVALGASGIAPVLAKSLTTWLTHRHSDITLTLSRNDGTTIEIDATRVQSRQVLGDLRDLLDPPDPSDPDHE